MTTISASRARASLYRLIDQASDTSDPVFITGKRNNAVLISEADWRAIQETLFLLAVPGMRESVREGLATPISECSPDVEW